MGSSEPGANSGQAERQGPEAGAPAALSEVEPRARRRVWMIVVLAGLVAGAVAWVAGELAHGLFRPRLYNVVIMGRTWRQPSRESQQAADLANATLGSA